MADRVVFIKYELGDTKYRPGNKNQDGPDVRSVFFQNDTSSDASVYLTRDASNNLVFRDAVTGAEKTLTQILNPSLTASQIANVGGGNMAATNLQAAINELQGDIDSLNLNKLSLTGGIVSGTLSLSKVTDALEFTGGGTTTRRSRIRFFGNAYDGLMIGIGPTNTEGVLEYFGGTTDNTSFGHRFLVGNATAGYATQLEMKGNIFKLRDNVVFRPFTTGNGALGDSTAKWASSNIVAGTFTNVFASTVNVGAASKYTNGGNYPFKFANVGPSLELYPTMNDFIGNWLMFADQKGGTLTTSGSITSAASAFRQGDTYATITNTTQPIVIEMAYTINSDTAVTGIRAFIEAHGTIQCNLQIEVQRNDDVWVEVSNEAILIGGREYWFSPPLTDAAAWPTYWNLKAIRWTITSLAQATTYIRQLGIFKANGFTYPFLPEYNPVAYGTMTISGSTVWHTGNATSLFSDTVHGNRAGGGLHAVATTSLNGFMSSTDKSKLDGLNSANYQPIDADLTSIAGLTGTSGLLRKTAANTWSLDTASYLTANQTITLSGDISGSGTTAITATLPNIATAGTYPKVTINAKGQVTGGTGLSGTDIPGHDWSTITTGKPTTLTGYGITDGQPLNTALTNLGTTMSPAGTGFLKKSGANTYSLDTTSYLPLSGGILTGFLTGKTILPDTDLTWDLGAAGAAFFSIYGNQYHDTGGGIRLFTPATGQNTYTAGWTSGFASSAHVFGVGVAASAGGKLARFDENGTQKFAITRHGAITLAGLITVNLPTAGGTDAPAGTLQYDTTTNEFKFSNGSTWTSLSGGGGGSYLPLTGGTLTGNLTIKDPNAATSGNTLVDSWALILRGQHWNGSASVNNDWMLQTIIDSTSVNRLIFAINGTNRLTIASNGPAAFSSTVSSAGFSTNGTTTTLELLVNGNTLDTEASGTVAGATLYGTVAKNDLLTKTFDMHRIIPVLNAGGSNGNTSVNVLAIDTTNTSLTGLTQVNLIKGSYGGTEKFALTRHGGLRLAPVPTVNLPTASGVEAGAGTIQYDSTVGKLKVSNGTTWQEVGGSSTHPTEWNFRIGAENNLPIVDSIPTPVYFGIVSWHENGLVPGELGFWNDINGTGQDFTYFEPTVSGIYHVDAHLRLFCNRTPCVDPYIAIYEYDKSGDVLSSRVWTLGYSNDLETGGLYVISMRGSVDVELSQGRTYCIVVFQDSGVNWTIDGDPQYNNHLSVHRLKTL